MYMQVPTTKHLLVTSETSVGELVELALVKVNIQDNPLYYCIWQVVTCAGGGRDKLEKETGGMKEEIFKSGHCLELSPLTDVTGYVYTM